MNSKTFRGFLERVVFVHSDDVLEPEFFRCLGSDFEGADNLTAVHSVEEVAVVDEKAGPGATLGAQAHEHHVEAEDLHVLDALATLALHRELELRTV